MTHRTRTWTVSAAIATAIAAPFLGVGSASADTVVDGHATALPAGCQYVDGNHISCSRPIPTNGQSMVTMGGNGTAYTGSTPSVAPSDSNHVRLNYVPQQVPHNYPGTVVGGQTRRPSDDDYAKPGSYAARNGIGHLVRGGDTVTDSYTTKITGLTPVRQGGAITGYRASDGRVLTNYAEALRYQDQLRAGR